MIKRIIPLIIILLLALPVNAKAARIFNCSWETGTGILNSSPGASEDAWNSENDAANEIDKDIGGHGWNNETNSMSAVCAGGTIARLFRNFTIDTSVGARVKVDWYSEGMTDTSATVFALADRLEVALADVGGTSKRIELWVHSGAGLVNRGYVDVSSYFNTGEVIQVIVKYIASTSAGMKVYREDGVTQIGSEVSTATVSSTGINYIYLGQVYAIAGKIWSAYFDGVYVDDVGDYPATQTTGAPAAKMRKRIITY